MNPRLGSWLLLAAVLVALPARADSLTDVFARGNDAFARGDYAAALREYVALEEAGVDDPDLAYNLGAAYGSLGQYGQAIRYFERTLRLSPRDSQARDALRAARDALGERQAQARGEAIVVDRPPLTEAIFAAFTPDALALTLLLAIWLAAGLWLALSIVRAEALRLATGIGAALCGVLALVSALGVGAKADWGRAGMRAVIVRESAALREAPDDRATLLGELTEGEGVRVLAREGRFARVLARGDRSGYVLGEHVGEI